MSPLCPAVSAEGEKKSRAAKLSKAEITVKRFGKGIVVDVSPLEGGPPVKVLHDPAQYDTVKAAGFQGVRIYVVAMRGPAVYKTRIDDALDRGLAVVISFWGNGGWVVFLFGDKDQTILLDRIALRGYRQYAAALG